MEEGDDSVRLKRIIALALGILLFVIGFSVLMRFGFIPDSYSEESMTSPTTVALSEEIEQKLFNISAYFQK